LQPAPVPPRLREKYLEFAAKAMLWNDGKVDEEEKRQWIAAARKQLQRTEELGMNDQTVLSYFAELCLQQDLKDQTKGVTNAI
jgi:hypothetical protein